MWGQPEPLGLELATADAVRVAGVRQMEYLRVARKEVTAGAVRTAEGRRLCGRATHPFTLASVLQQLGDVRAPCLMGWLGDLSGRGLCLMRRLARTIGPQCWWLGVLYLSKLEQPPGSWSARQRTWMQRREWIAATW